MIGFFEGTTPLELHSAMEEHMLQCERCKTIFENVTVTYALCEDRRNPPLSPYFYGRIQQKRAPEVPAKSFMTRVLPAIWQPVAATLLIAAGIGIGISIGRNVDIAIAKDNPATDKNTVNSVATDYYLYHSGEDNLVDNLLMNE